jgi:RNA polymerase-binding transcription factor DksA
MACAMPLSPDQGSELRGALERRREELVRELRDDLARIRAETHRDVAGPSADPGDESVFDLLSDLSQAETRRDVGELRAIEAARGRFDEGHYGECIECGQDIGYARLKATPSALRCIVCQTRYEKTHAAGGGRPTL